MNPKWLLCAAWVVLAMPGRAPAQEKNVNVAVVDLAFTFEKYAMTKDLEAMFDERRRAAAAEAERKRASVEAKRKNLLALKPESAEFTQLEQEITRMEIEYEVWAAHQEQALKRDHKRWLMRIYKDVKDAVAQIALSSKIDLVLTYDQLTEDAPDSIALRQQILLQKIIYFDDRIDLTQAVLSQVNAKYEADGGAAGLRLGLTSSFDERSGAGSDWSRSAALERSGAPGFETGPAVN